MVVQVGLLELTVVEAEYEEQCVEGECNTFCALILLESLGWRRRKSKRRTGLNPKFGETFTFENVSSDSKLAVDVWNVPEDASSDEYFGKVVVKIAEALESPKEAWQFLLPGQLQISATWTPYLDADQQRLGTPVKLTLPPEPKPLAPSMATASASTSAPVSPARATGTSAAPSLAEAAVQPVGGAQGVEVSAEGLPTPPRQAQNRALKALEAAAAEYEEDEFEEDEEEEEEEEEEEKVYTTVVATTKPATTKAAVSVVAPTSRASVPSRPAEFYEFTHKGGTGNGPKENQDAHFLAQIDDKNAVFGVLDGHGQDHGRVAAHAAAAACKEFLLANFERLRSSDERGKEAVMVECFEAAHKAVFKAIKREQGIFEDPETPGVLVMEMPEEEWPLGFDAADGGTTCSVGAYIDGRTLVYAAAGDSCSLLGVPCRSEDGERGAFAVEELVPEHSPTNVDDWSQRLCKTGVHVVFDTGPDMFDDQPASLLPIFTKDGKGGWEISDATLAKADELGCGLKTERGDRASVVMTPESGRFSQMMLGVTRSVGDFYHQTYGVTWRPEVVIKDLHAECEAAAGIGGSGPSSAACLIIASDGVWDHWEFGESMDVLCDPEAEAKAQPLTDRRRVLDFFEETRAKGEEAFGDGADNLTGVVAVFPNPGPRHAEEGVAKPRPGHAAGLPGRPGMPGMPRMSLEERDLSDEGDNMGA